MTDPVQLPSRVTVDQAFSQRLPSQRSLDLMVKLEGGAAFGDLAQSQPFRMVAFRALLRDFPDYDPAALWLHAYDVEVDVVESDPTNGKSPTLALGSVVSGS